MKKGIIIIIVIVMLPEMILAAGQTGGAFRVEADVFNSDDPGLSAGSGSMQGSVSAGQFSLVVDQAGGTFVVESGYQATTEGFDTDYDGVPDSLDTDSDDDGIPDVSDSLVYDTDNDGDRNLTDDDDDNDLLEDVQEQLAGTSPLITDTDGDRYSDYEEVIVTGTSGLDSNDYLRVDSVSTPGADEMVVQWDAVPGKVYHVFGQASLVDPGAWVDMSGPITATVTALDWTHSGAVSTQYNYRVSVPY